LLEIKFQIPSTKSQTSSKHQWPNDPNEESAPASSLFGSLEFGNWNLFGIWCLCFGAFVFLAVHR
jgi:hypothetical protein